jgi:hypothetical protein
MNLDRVKKKLREAEFFLGKMQDEERERFGPKEPFEFYLSAFLTASKSVVEVFEYLIKTERADANRQWYKGWKTKRGADEHLSNFVKCMADKRDAEVHRKGAGHRVKIEQREFPNTHLERSVGAFTLVGAPHGVPLGHYDVNRYYLTVNGSEQLVLEACAKYVEFRRRLVTEFEAASPLTQ